MISRIHSHSTGHYKDLVGMGLGEIPGIRGLGSEEGGLVPEDRPLTGRPPTSPRPPPPPPPPPSPPPAIASCNGATPVYGRAKGQKGRLAVKSGLVNRADRGKRREGAREWTKDKGKAAEGSG